MIQSSRTYARLFVLAASLFGVSAGESAWGWVVECPRDLPAVAYTSDNFMGPPENGYPSIYSPNSRTAEDFTWDAANYMFFRQGVPLHYDLLYPSLLHKLFNISENYYSGYNKAPVCNELGQCGTLTIWADWNAETSEVSIPISDIIQDNGLFELVGFQVEVAGFLEATRFYVQVDFGGQNVTKAFAPSYITRERNRGKFDATYDPTFPIPSEEASQSGDDDLRCRDNNGNLAGPDADSYGGGYDYPEYDYDEEAYGWAEWEASHGIPSCYADYSDPAGAGVICFTPHY